MWISSSQEVPFRLNEVMALNNTFVTDEAGGYADWVEIVNVGNSPTNVQGLHLTNRRSEPQRFTFPSSVDAGDHRVLWCDNDLKTDHFTRRSTSSQVPTTSF